MTDDTTTTPTGDTDLIAEIAGLLGWTELCLGLTGWHGVPPGRSHRKPIPDYDRDPAAALSLLEHVLLHCRTHATFIGYFATSESYHCGLKVRVKDDFWEPVLGQADILPEAIARACRDALRALKEVTP